MDLNHVQIAQIPSWAGFNAILYPEMPVAGFSLTRKCASETHCLAEKWKRDGERVLSDAHGLRMVVYYWSLNLKLKRSAKNSFENKIRIWNLCSVFLVHLSTPKPATITPLN